VPARRLAAGGKSAGVRDVQAEVLIRIDGRVVDADFVVEMRASRSSARADITNDVAAMNVLAGSCGEAGKMAVAGTNAVTMVEHDGLAITTKQVDESDDPVGRCNHLMSIAATDIYTAVEGTFTVKRINALPEAARSCPSTGQRFGAELARNQSAVVALRVRPRVM